MWNDDIIFPALGEGEICVDIRVLAPGARVEVSGLTSTIVGPGTTFLATS
jgi:hypothetical protein